MAEKYQ
jgi:hypothetical protein